MKAHKILKLIFTIMFSASVFLLYSCSSQSEDNLSIVIKDGKEYRCDFVIVYGEGGREYAEHISDLMNEKYGIAPACRKYGTDETSEFKILVMAKESADYRQLEARATEKNSTDSYYTWGYSASGNDLILYFSHDTYAKDKLTELLRPLMKKSGFSVYRDTEVINHKSIYLQNTEDKLADSILSYGELKNRFYEALYKNDELLSSGDGGYLSLFGASITESLSSEASTSYPKPNLTPQADTHPRVNVNKDLLISAKTAIKQDELANARSELMRLADDDFSGEFGYGVTDEEIAKLLSVIEAKAFVYLLTDKTAYAYEALVCIKHALLTVPNSNEIAPRLMEICAEVYDWCYPILTDRDKEQMVAGVQKYISSLPKGGIGFPPTELSVSMLNTRAEKMLYGYLCFSCAIYDDYPDWWEFCAGRFYSEFKDGASDHLKGGAVLGGSALYAAENLYTYLKISTLLTALGDDAPYGGIDRAYISLLAHAMPNGGIFPTGDGSPNITAADAYYKISLMSASLFDDATALYYGKLYSEGYTKLDYSLADSWTPVNLIIYLSDAPALGEDEPVLPLLQYTPSPLGQIIGRNSWNENAAAVLMKIGEINNATGGHRDSGTFQIYYKGLLAGASGIYEEATNHQKYYNSATVSKNGFLIFDPTLYEKPELDKDGNITNPDKAFYTGGQAYTYGDAAANSSYFCKYKNDGSLKYAYLGADYSTAYNENSVRLAERKMLAVYTDNPEIPMLFIVFDKAISENPNAEKKFLLHTKSEPEFIDNNSDGRAELVLISDGGGTLVLNPLFGAEDITKIGGAENNFNVNDIQLSPSNNESPDSSMWGRVEVSASGECETSMLNLMYVKDRESDELLTPGLIKSDALIGVQIDNEVAVFANNSLQNSQHLEFEAEEFKDSTSDNNNINYLVSGVESGVWTILVDGLKYGAAVCPTDKDVISFSAPAGKITLVPSFI